MSEHVLLIHGWSADDESMADVGTFLKGKNFETSDLFLGSYPSMADDVRIEDSARRMHAVIQERQASGDLPSRFHLIVHSTGALVARRWLADRFPQGGSPIDNFLMLAPANFGSPLATLGRSMLTRIVKGWRRGFQTGTEFLHGLELGSRFQEELALADRLSDGNDTASPFSGDGTRPYVIVGAHPIPGTQLTGETAWDGTVRVASANLDPQGVTVDFTQGSLTNPAVRPWKRRGPDKTAFAVIPDRTHLTILKPIPGKSLSKNADIGKRLGDMIVAALETTSAAAYEQVCADWKAISNETRQLAQRGAEADALRKKILNSSRADRDRFCEFYQVVVEAVDETGLPVDDFEIWLTAPKKGSLEFRADLTIRKIEIDARNNLIRDEHRNRRNPERRVLHIDRRALMQRGGFFRRSVTSSYEDILAAAITATAPGDKIAYFTRDTREATALIPLRALDPSKPDEADRFLKRYATHFVRVVVPRIADDDVFAMRPMA